MPSSGSFPLILTDQKRLAHAEHEVAARQQNRDVLYEIAKFIDAPEQLALRVFWMLGVLPQ